MYLLLKLNRNLNITTYFLYMAEIEKKEDENTYTMYNIIQYGHYGVMQTIHTTFSVNRHTKHKA